MTLTLPYVISSTGYIKELQRHGPIKRPIQLTDDVMFAIARSGHAVVPCDKDGNPIAGHIARPNEVKEIFERLHDEYVQEKAVVEEVVEDTIDELPVAEDTSVENAIIEEVLEENQDEAVEKAPETEVPTNSTNNQPSIQITPNKKNKHNHR